MKTLINRTILTLFIFAPISVFSKDCDFKITGSDQLKYDLKEIRVPKDCSDIKITVATSGKMPANAMGHNFVLTKTSDWNAVAAAEGKAMPPSPQYVPKDKRIIAATSFVGGAGSDPKEASVTIKRRDLKDSESYHFFCSFPGHFATMNGAFILEK